MRWPSLFALLPNCEVECVNINQMVPVILKQASPLPATHPLPPLSTALTLSSHFSPQAFAAISFVLKSCHPKCLIPPCFFSWAGATFFLLPPRPSLATPSSWVPPYNRLLLTSNVTKHRHVGISSWSSCEAKCCSSSTRRLALPAV